mmetsp:Transcript_6948/g.42453  ORF Transcript_6948/g.42453 Transcript_6948/m.42453 type:complete len:225 (+) Transcript_6948:3051-3725(+)
MCRVHKCWMTLVVPYFVSREGVMCRPSHRRWPPTWEGHTLLASGLLRTVHRSCTARGVLSFHSTRIVPKARCQPVRTVPLGIRTIPWPSSHLHPRLPRRDGTRVDAFRPLNRHLRHSNVQFEPFWPVLLRCLAVCRTHQMRFPGGGLPRPSRPTRAEDSWRQNRPVGHADLTLFRSCDSAWRSFLPPGREATRVDAVGSTCTMGRFASALHLSQHQSVGSRMHA